MVQVSEQSVMTEFYPLNWIAKPETIVVPISVNTYSFPIVSAFTEITGDLLLFQHYDLLQPLIQPSPRRFGRDICPVTR